MSDDRLDADTTAMNRFAANLLATAAKELPATLTREDVACGGGMAECAGLLGADQRSTQRLRELITQVQQGFAGYASFARTSGAEYLRADDTARRVLLDALRTHRGDGVPDVSPALLPPPRET